MSSGEKEFYSTIYALSSIAAEFTELIESDFAAANGAVYSPPEPNAEEFRRVNVARTIQLLKNAVLGYKTSQTNTGSILRLPCGLISTNDALDGRPFIIWNGGTSNLTVQNYSGTVLATVKINQRFIFFHTENDVWLTLFVAKDIQFDNSSNGFVSTDVQTALEEINTKIKKVKAGIIASGTFAGNPKKATVTFATQYTNASYSINITGIDARSWTYESKLNTGFVINTNANKVLTGEVSWESIYQGEN